MLPSFPLLLFAEISYHEIELQKEKVEGINVVVYPLQIK